VGAWGISYAANTTLRAASLQPRALRAIIAVAHTLDAGRHSVHPDGARGDLHALVNRGMSMLLQQLLPPLVDYASPQAQARWRQRLHDVEPVLLDYARRGPDDPSWSQEAIPGGDITTPALLVGGWRDSFAAGLTDAYQRLAGPKRLVIGPWGHLLPHESGHGPVDFLALALRWWNEWLRGDPPTEDPQAAPVLVSIGETQWRAYDTWPPATTSQRHVAAADALTPSGDQALVPRQPAGPSEPVGRYVPDPTVGMLRGLPGLGLGESCPPQDQHDDDLRCVHATGAPLAADIIIAGQPQVTVRLDAAVARVVVRLCAVDRAGRSTLVSTGVLRPASGTTEHRIALTPVHVRLPVGARLRVTVGDSDFPRLTPLSSPPSFTVQELALLLPVVPAGVGRPVSVGGPAHHPGRPGPVKWAIVRDPSRGYAEVTIESDTGLLNSRDGHQYRVRGRLSAAVRQDAPSASRCTGSHTGEVRLCTGEYIKATVSIRCTQDAVYAHAQTSIDGFILSEQRWHAALTRE
jgi:putative CocE/NonD family hydrolase